MSDNKKKLYTTMEKKHQLPEFQVIIQDMANVKFFVASGGFEPGTQGEQIVTAKYDYTEGDESKDGNDSVW